MRGARLDRGIRSVLPGFPGRGGHAPADSPLDITEFKILNAATGQVETVSVRDYVRGAVAAELPATFHAEAMKAQAVAAHTWALHCALTQRENPDPALKGADFSADPDHLKG